MIELYLIMLYNHFDNTSKLMGITMDRDIADEVVSRVENDLNEDQTLEVEDVHDIYIDWGEVNKIIGFSPVEKAFIRRK